MNILIVDDSVVYRSAIAKALEGVEDLNVVGTARNGRIALDKLDELKPDLITLDIEMPEMDGIEALKEIRIRDQKVVIIMFSSLTVGGAEKTIEALLIGANDFLAKTDKGDDLEESIGLIKCELVPKIKQFIPRFIPKKGGSGRSDIDEGVERPGLPYDILPVKPEVICIGSSTGGPEALRALFSGIKINLEIPILIVQHMPPIFTGQLAKMLNSKSPINVKEGRHGEEIRKGFCYIAPGDFHMTVQNSGNTYSLSLNKEERVNYVRPAVDLLFHSVAAIPKLKSMAIVLTGMGEDGLAGARELKTRGTPIIIQDKQSSVVWGMPGAIFREGIQDMVLPINKIAASMEKAVLGG